MSWVRVPPEAAHFSVTALGVLWCCLFDLGCFFLPSFSSLIKTCTYHTRLYRLREKCMAILLLCCSYRRKAEELLWKKVFYELVQRSKSNKQVRSMYMTAVGSSFHCGMGVQYEKFRKFWYHLWQKREVDARITLVHVLHLYMHHSYMHHVGIMCSSTCTCIPQSYWLCPQVATCPYTYTCTYTCTCKPTNCKYTCCSIQHM